MKNTVIKKTICSVDKNELRLQFVSATDINTNDVYFKIIGSKRQGNI